MKAAVTVELDGATFILDEDAYQALRSYLDRAAARLRKHPDRADVIAGLERRIAAKLASGPAANGAPLDHDEMVEVLKGVGRVDGPELAESSAAADPSATGGAAAADAAAGGRSRAGSSRSAGPGAAADQGERGRTDQGEHRGPRARRLYRLREGQQVAGVCAGLAAFSEIDVGLIRFLFLICTMFSGGVLILGYVVLAFLMPVAHTEAEVAEAHGGLSGRLTRG